MKLLCALILVTASVAYAGRGNFAWTPSPSTGAVTYVLYAHTNSLVEATLPAAAVRAQTGTNLAAAILFTNAGRWYLRVTARLDKIESEPSHELVVVVPAGPGSIGTVVIEHTLDVPGTNWTDVGFFRLRINP